MIYRPSRVFFPLSNDPKIKKTDHLRPHDTIHPPFWVLAGITGANGSSWN